MMPRPGNKMLNVLNTGARILGFCGFCAQKLCVVTTKKTLLMASVFYAKTFSYTRSLGTPTDPATAIVTSIKLVIGTLDLLAVVIALLDEKFNRERQDLNRKKTHLIIKLNMASDFLSKGNVSAAKSIMDLIETDLTVMHEIDRETPPCKKYRDLTFGFMHSLIIYAGSNLAAILYANSIDVTFENPQLIDSMLGLSLGTGALASYYDVTNLINESQALTKELSTLHNNIDDKLSPTHKKNKGSSATITKSLSPSVPLTKYRSANSSGASTPADPTPMIRMLASPNIITITSPVTSSYLLPPQDRQYRLDHVVDISPARSEPSDDIRLPGQTYAS